MSTPEDLDDLAERRLDGEISDSRWLALQAAHGPTLAQALARASTLRGAVVALPRPALPPAMRAAILAAAAASRSTSVPGAKPIMSSPPPRPGPVLVPSGRHASSPRRVAWRILVPVALAAGIIVAISLAEKGVDTPSARPNEVAQAERGVSSEPTFPLAPGSAPAARREQLSRRAIAAASDQDSAVAAKSAALDGPAVSAASDAALPSPDAATSATDDVGALATNAPIRDGFDQAFTARARSRAHAASPIHDGFADAAGGNTAQPSPSLAQPSIARSAPPAHPSIAHGHALPSFEPGNAAAPAEVPGSTTQATETAAQTQPAPSILGGHDLVADLSRREFGTDETDSTKQPSGPSLEESSRAAGAGGPGKAATSDIAAAPALGRPASVAESQEPVTSPITVGLAWATVPSATSPSPAAQEAKLAAGPAQEAKLAAPPVAARTVAIAVRNAAASAVDLPPGSLILEGIDRTGTVLWQRAIGADQPLHIPAADGVTLNEIVGKDEVLPLEVVALRLRWQKQTSVPLAIDTP